VQTDQDHGWKKSDSDVGCCCYQLLPLLVVVAVVIVAVVTSCPDQSPLTTGLVSRCCLGFRQTWVDIRHAL